MTNIKKKIEKTKTKELKSNISFMISINENLNIYFPLDLKPRDQQLEILELVKKSINSGKKYILLNSPTGSGKSYLAVAMISNWYKNFVNKDAKFDIITNSKILQEQYKRDYNFINDLRGRSNYKCSHHNTDCHTGKELNKSLKYICQSCPYDIAKGNWVNGNISLTNFHLFNSFVFYVPETMIERNSNVLIIDEAHSMEDVFCDFISTKLSAKIFRNYGMEEVSVLNFERYLTEIKTVGQFISFIEKKFLPFIIDLRDNFESLIAETDIDKLKKTYVDFIIYIDSSIEKFDKLLKDFEKTEDNWALDITRDKVGNIEIILQPIWGKDYLKKLVYDYYDHIIFMSASILDKDMFSYINGLESDLTDYYELDSTFDIENRRIYYIPCGKMNYQNKKMTFDNQINMIKKILKKYKNDKGIIHTTNYEISEWIKNSIDSERLIFHDSDNREKMLEKHIKSRKPTVIVSPSMMSGLDLKDDLSRFQIICKIPYPNLGSNKIKSRKESNPDSYTLKTCQDLLQSYGRSVRSTEDHAETYILDSSFQDLLRYSYKFLPAWFTDSIKRLT